MNSLRLNDKGLAVRTLQGLLNARGARISVDGDFGPATRDALQAFQRSAGLTADGVYGPATRAALTGGMAQPPPTALAVFPAPWMDIALAEEGQRENAAKGKENPRIVEYHATTMLRAKTDETPWCSSFVNWVMEQAGYRGTGSAAAVSWVHWGRDLPLPRYGAVMVIRRLRGPMDQQTGSHSGNHVGFYVAKTETHVQLFGGNQSDRVKTSPFPLDRYRIVAKRWPEADPSAVFREG